MKILVTGGSGMVGRELQEILPDAIYPGRNEYDLTVQEQVNKMFRYIRPDVVIHLAATVSGIIDNIKRPCSHFEENILMNTFMVQAARKFEVGRFMAMLSTCIYPDVAIRYPLHEEDIHDSAPAESNFGYAYAKRALAVQIDTCNKQYGTNYSYMIPCNMYGRYDKFDEVRSHFMGALLAKIYDAEVNGRKYIELYGTGNPRRQFVYAKDVAKIIKYCIDNDIYQNMNIAPDQDNSIEGIAMEALIATGHSTMDVFFDRIKPDGQFNKNASNKIFRNLLPDFNFTPLEQGIKETYAFYKQNAGKSSS